VPTSDSAEKRARQNKKRHKRNKKTKSHVRTTLRRFEEAVEDEDLETARERLREAESAWDRAASKGVVPKKRASRKVGRMKRELNQLEEELS
jgi:small subunit ribosomal protein S20